MKHRALLIFIVAVCFAAAVAVPAFAQPTTTFADSIPAAGRVSFIGPRAAVAPMLLAPEITSSAANALVQAGGRRGPWILGTVNGGLWRTTDSPFETTSPRWHVVSDANVTCSSIVCLHVSAADSRRVYAGCGAATSSQQGFATSVRNDAGWTGFAVSTDAGATWQMAAGDLFLGQSIESIVELADGALLVAVSASYGGDAENTDKRGIWRLDDYRKAVAPAPSTSASSPWRRTYSESWIFSLVADTASSSPPQKQQQIVYASAGAIGVERAVIVSADGGVTFAPTVRGLSLFPGPVPQCTWSSLAIDTKNRNLFFYGYTSPAALLRLGLSAGVGLVYRAALPPSGGGAFTGSWQRVGAQPVLRSPYDTSPSDASAPYGDGLDYPYAFHSLDGEYSTKDRGAIAVDPVDGQSFIYVAGNNDGWSVFRVNWTAAIAVGNYTCTLNNTDAPPYPCLNRSVDAQIWSPMLNNNNKPYPYRRDTIDDHEPHVDMRAIAFGFRNDSSDNEHVLLLMSDGGVYVRFAPTQVASGGARWASWAGDIGVFEAMHSSMYALPNGTCIFIVALQDNDVVIASTTGASGALGYGASLWNGDGAFTATSLDPDDARRIRFYGSTENLNNLGAVSLDASFSQPLSIASNDAQTVRVPPLPFPHRAEDGTEEGTSAFSWMSMPFVINRAAPARLYYFANASSPSLPGSAPGLFSINVSTRSRGEAGASRFELAARGGELLLGQEAGGVLDGVMREDVIVAASAHALYVAVGNGGGMPSATVTYRPFPVPFATPTVPRSNPVADAYCRSKQAVSWSSCTRYAQVWPPHAASVFLEVDWRTSMRTAAVGGWPLDSMYGDFGARPAAAEHIFFTTDAGDTWVDLLAGSNAMAAVGANPAYTFLRPAAMAFVRRDASALVLFVGTARGIIATLVPASSSAARGSGFVAAWRRIGATASEFPLVKVMSAVWYPASDVVLVATLGRGVYTLSKASTTLTASLPGVAAAPSTIDLPLVLGLAIGLGGAALLAIAAVAVYVMRRRRGAQTWRTAGGEIAYQEHDYQ